MKKTLFAALALVSMVSCSNEEVLEVAQKEAIGFENAFVNNSTRSVNDPSYTNTNLFQEFKVYGYVNGASLWTSGEDVTGTALNGEWGYTNTQYWIAGGNYAFHALAPSMAATSNSSTGLTLQFTNTDGKSDVLYATASRTNVPATGNTKVQFDFKHILSKVKFSFENAYNSTSASIKVKDIKIHNSYATGTVSLSSNGIVWSAQTGSTTNPLAFGIATDVESTTDATKENTDNMFAYGITRESQEELLLIPGAAPTQQVDDAEVTGYKVTFTVELYVSESLIDTYYHTVYVNFTPAPSNAYDIKAVINPENIDPENPEGQEAIQFTVTNITDWEENNVLVEDEEEGA